MPDPVDSVKEIARRYRQAASSAQGRNEAAVADRFNADAAGLEEAASELQRLVAWSKPVPADYGDVSDLPPELLAQLSGVKTDTLEDLIYATVKAAGDSIELDRLLIELYRRSAVVHQRRFLMNKCYRMAQKGLIHIVAGRKGVYTALHPDIKPANVLVEPASDSGGFRPAAPPEPATFDNILDDDVFGEDEEEEEEEEEEEIPF